MTFDIPVWYEIFFLPTRRHRKERRKYSKSLYIVTIPELKESEFPAAFIVRKWQSVYKDARNYNDFDGNGDFRLFDETIRTYGGKLFRPVRVTHGAAISEVFEPVSYISRQLQMRKPWNKLDEADFAEDSIVVRDNLKEIGQEIQKSSENYVIFNGIVWERCGEPRYVVNTFGLGYNHGGTGMFIDEYYNPNISKEAYFSALEKEEAVAYANRVAEARGDTNDVGKFGKDIDIKVLMPECVHCDPKKEHGDGDPFMNSMEQIIEAAGDPFAAGLLVITKTARGKI